MTRGWMEWSATGDAGARSSWGLSDSAENMTHGLVKGRVWGELRNPAYGGTFDLFSGNRVYEQGRSA